MRLLILAILIGGPGPMRTLRTVALRADARNTSGWLDEMRAKVANLARRCADAPMWAATRGRSSARSASQPPFATGAPRLMRRLPRRGRVAPPWPNRAALAAHNGAQSAGNVQHIHGSPREITDEIRSFRDEFGFRRVIARLPVPHDAVTLARIGEVRAALAG
jgi:hypothetical protein